MDRERLKILSFDALQEFARQSGIRLADENDKATIIDQILEAIEEDRSDRERSNNIEMLVKEKKFELNPDDALEYREMEELSLPESYDETGIAFLLRDPSWGFAYWDLDSEYRKLALRDAEARKFRLRVWESAADGDSEEMRFYDIPLRGNERRWYVNLPETGRYYFVELVYLDGEIVDIERAGVRAQETETPDGDSTADGGSSIGGNGSQTEPTSRSQSTKEPANGVKPDVEASPGRGKVLCRSNVIASPNLSPADYGPAAELERASILSVAGLPEMDDIDGNGAIPQRIISLLDTQYLQLKG